MRLYEKILRFCEWPPYKFLLSIMSLAVIISQSKYRGQRQKFYCRWKSNIFFQWPWIVMLKKMVTDFQALFSHSSTLMTTKNHFLKPQGQSLFCVIKSDKVWVKNGTFLPKQYLSRRNFNPEFLVKVSGGWRLTKIHEE